MKKGVYILFTAGRGPIECGIAVQGIQNRFKKYLDSIKIPYEIVSQKKGDIPKSMENILFQVFTSDLTLLEPWMGTIQWICKSPIRKFHKRKNWFIKCERISMPKELDVDIKNVSIQTYKASGPGGQHRNKVETAIRIIHNPTGIIVTASNGRSQSQNKQAAWYRLREALATHNRNIKSKYDLDRWSNQKEIQRGNPVKNFEGVKFVEI